MLSSLFSHIALGSGYEEGRQENTFVTTLFSSGSTTQIASAIAGQPDSSVNIRLPVGSHVLSAEVTLGGASDKGWASKTSNVQEDWEEGTWSNIDPHSDSLSLGLNSPSPRFFSHGPGEMIGVGSSANRSDENFAVRQPATSSITESLLSVQRQFQPGITAQYSSAIIRFQGMTFMSTWESGIPFNSTVKLLHSNNGSISGNVFVDKSSCTIPSISTSFSSAYGFLDFTYDGNEHVYGILTTYRSPSYIPDTSYLRVIKFNVQDL